MIETKTLRLKYGTEMCIAKVPEGFELGFISSDESVRVGLIISMEEMEDIIKFLIKETSND